MNKVMHSVMEDRNCNAYHKTLFFSAKRNTQTKKLAFGCPLLLPPLNNQQPHYSLPQPRLLPQNAKTQTPLREGEDAAQCWRRRRSLSCGAPCTGGSPHGCCSSCSTSSSSPSLSPPW